LPKELPKEKACFISELQVFFVVYFCNVKEKIIKKPLVTFSKN